MDVLEGHRANVIFPMPLMLPIGFMNVDMEAPELLRAPAKVGGIVPSARLQQADAASPSATILSNSAALFPPGLSAPDGILSHGSALHGSGNCRPCAWFWKSGGCRHGSDCQHCHVCPEGELKARKKNKNAMMRLGLATPKPFCDVTDFSSFFPLDQGSTSEVDVSTTCSSPEQEALTTCTSEEDEILSSVISSLGLEDTLLTSGKARTGSSDDASPRLRMPPNTPNQGLFLHQRGMCKPCAWFWKQSGCQNGRDCAYCHLCTEGELKARKKSKHTAMRLGLVTPKALPNAEQEARYALKLAACI